MSYILDALRKADSEREQGQVPGLHAQSIPVESTDSSHASQQVNQKLIWAVGILGSLLALILVWLIWGRDTPPPPHGDMPPPGSYMGYGPPTGMPKPATRAPQEIVSQAPIQIPPTQPSPVGVYPPAPEATPAVPAKQEAATTNTASTSPQSNTQAAASTTKPRKEEDKLYKFSELPDSVRKDLPTLTIGGAMYSETPSQRMLIINSQVLHEGDKITPELTLEEVKLKSAIFRFRNYRYLVSY